MLVLKSFPTNVAKQNPADAHFYRDADGNKKYIPKPGSESGEKMINPEYNPRTLYVPKDFLDNETPVSVAHVMNLNIHNFRVATAQGKQGIWLLLFPDRENTGNFALTQGKILRHRENIFL